MNAEIISEYIDIIEKKSGKIGKYQFSVALNGMLCMCVSFATIINSPMFELKPSADFEYTNQKWDNGTAKMLWNKQFNNDICAGIANKTLTKLQYTNAPGYSMYKELEFECDTLIVGILNMTMFGGALICLFFMSLYLDVLGRKKMILMGTGICGIACLLPIIAPNKYVIVISFLIINVFAMFSVQTFIVAQAEVTSNRRRSILGSVVQVGYQLGVVIFNTLTFYLESWKMTFWIVAMYCIIKFLWTYFFMYDTPKFFLKKKDYVGYMITLLQTSCFNSSFTLLFDSLVCNPIIFISALFISLAEHFFL